MSNKITLELELNPTQVERLVDKLSIQNKIRLIRKLTNENWTKRLDKVVLRIRKRVKEVGINDKDIDRLCEEVKKEYDEKHLRS